MRDELEESISVYWKVLKTTVWKYKMRIHLATLYLLSDTREKEKASRKNISCNNIL